MKKIFVVFMFLIAFFMFSCNTKPVKNQAITDVENEIDALCERFTLDYIFENSEDAECEINDLKTSVHELTEEEQKSLRNYDTYLSMRNLYKKYESIAETDLEIEELSKNFKKRLGADDASLEDEMDEIEAKIDEDAVNHLMFYDEFLGMKNKFLEYKAQKEEEEKRREAARKYFEAAEEYLRSTVPDSWKFENNNCQMELPYEFVADDGKRMYISWESNNPHLISKKGLVILPRVNTSVKLTAKIRCGDIEHEFAKNVIVASRGFKPLPAKPVFAYYYSGQRALTPLEASTIDVINLSFGTIGNDGSIQVYALNLDTVLPERLKGIRVCFSVQSPKENFVKFTKTAEARKKLAGEFVKTIEEYHFDGVDIDWEYPVGKEVANYVEFMKELYTQVKAANNKYLVTSALYGGQGSVKYDAGKSCQYMDYAHLMTYDLNSDEKTTHLTPLGNIQKGYNTAMGTVKHYIEAGVPKEKIVIGAAFYGKYYRLPESAGKFYYETPTSKPYSIVYSEINNSYLARIGKEGNMKVERVWDENFAAPYLQITEYGKSGEPVSKGFITYDDQESVRRKCQYVIDNDLGGLMFWQLGGDTRNDENSLVSAIHSVMD